MLTGNREYNEIYKKYKNRECETFSVNNVLEGLLW